MIDNVISKLEKRIEYMYDEFGVLMNTDDKDEKGLYNIEFGNCIARFGSARVEAELLLQLIKESLIK